ncbi:MAG: ABC transporter permease [Hyphomonadaceae bacterium]|nr:ABC transporter permease [Hyphomonadaceae bacterium]
MAAMRDIWGGLRMHRIWFSLAWFEFTSTYRRSALGVLWIAMSFAAFIFVKLIIFSSLLSSDDASFYDTYLVLGFFIWIYQMQSITNAPDTFVAAKGWIISENLPLSLYIYKSISRELFNLVLTFIVVVAAIIYIGYQIGDGVLYSIMGLLFLIINSFFVKLLLGIIGTRIRDITHFVRAVMQAMLFLTPIFWLPEQMGRLMDYLWWNPLFHYLEIFRAPLLTGAFPTQSWIFVLSLWAIIVAFALLMFIRFRQRIVFWL